MKLSTLTLAALAGLAAVAQAQAAPLIYRGNNPNITPGAPVYNTAGIEKRADLTRPRDPRASRSSETFSQSELVKRGIASGLSAQYVAQLTSNTPGSGSVDLGEQGRIEYVTNAHDQTIIFYDFNGNETDRITRTF